MDCSEEVGVSRVFKGHTVSTSIITVLFSSKPLSITYPSLASNTLRASTLTITLTLTNLQTKSSLA